ncbi:hypothetical protein ACGIF2_06270 [Cellulomonas sp. P22]|uniref:hypothetical protein n=1 Tax=Cellulomonas sp. P22 TaxID=3373189 RepID=UPI0037946398
MRWESLFADMEAQLAAQESAELGAQVSELTRAERATVTVADRLRASRGARIGVRVRGGALVDGVVLDTAPEWLLLGEQARRTLVPLDAVTAVVGLVPHAAPAPGEVERRLGLGHALRALARDRVVVRVETDGAELTGRIERVGADHLDLVTGHGEVLRGGTWWTVPFAGLRAVRSG